MFQNPFTRVRNADEPQTFVRVTNAEAIIILNALRRSTEAMPEPAETLAMHSKRIEREGKLAHAIRTRLK